MKTSELQQYVDQNQGNKEFILRKAGMFFGVTYKEEDIVGWVSKLGSNTTYCSTAECSPTPVERKVAFPWAGKFVLGIRN